MAERYTRVFTLPENDLYEIGAPLLICTGALLKDTQTGRVIAQLKFRNIGTKPITAVKVSVRAFDAFGTEVEGVPEFQYLDLSVTRDREFGQKTPIVLPNAETRSFSCACQSAIFSDGSVWDAQTEDWKPLTKQQSLESRFGDLAAQYRRDTHSPSAKYAVAEDRDLWLCACGAVNRKDEVTCHGCKAKREALQTAENPEQLKEHDEAHLKRIAKQAEAARLEKERKAEEARIEAERKAEEERIAKKREKKRRSITAIVSISVILIVAVLLAIFVIIPNERKNKAYDICERGIDDWSSVIWDSAGSYFSCSRKEFIDSRKITYTKEIIEKDSFRLEGIITYRGAGKSSISDIFGTNSKGEMVVNTNPKTKQIVVTIPFTCVGNFSDGGELTAGNVDVSYE